MAEAHDPYAALRSPDYRRLLLGNVLTSVATSMQGVVVAWDLYDRTESAAVLGFIGLVQFLPVLFLSLPAGQAADRYSRKWLLLLTQGLFIASSLGLAALSAYGEALGHAYRDGLAGRGLTYDFSPHDLPVGLTYLCLLLVGIGRAIAAPARWALVAQVVPAAQLTNAVTWNSSGWQVATVAGPTFAGLMLAVAPPTAAYLVAAGTILVGALLIVGLRPRTPPAPREAPSLGSLLAGARFVWRTKLILAALTLDLFAVLLGGATALLPIYARDILRVGPVGLGWLEAAPSLGAFGMAFVMAHRPPLRRAGPALLLSVAGFGVATVVFGLSTSFPLSFAMLALTGALDNISVVIRHTLVQTLTPDDMRGRVAAVNSIFISSSNQLGAFESGMVAAWVGPVNSVVSGGVGTIVVVLAVAVVWPAVARLRSLHDVPAEPPPPPPPTAPEALTSVREGEP